MVTITIAGWMIPTAITILAILWAFFGVKDEGGYFCGISNVLALIPALAVSLVSWIGYVIVMAIL